MGGRPCPISPPAFVIQSQGLRNTMLTGLPQPARGPRCVSGPSLEPRSARPYAGRGFGLLLALALALPASAETFDGRRAVIIDGDTIALGDERVRLLNIDAPESFRSRCERELVMGLNGRPRPLRSARGRAAWPGSLSAYPRPHLRGWPGSRTGSDPGGARPALARRTGGSCGSAPALVRVKKKRPTRERLGRYRPVGAEWPDCQSNACKALRVPTLSRNFAENEKSARRRSLRWPPWAVRLRGLSAPTE
jgi:hypothetical protein